MSGAIHRRSFLAGCAGSLLALAAGRPAFAEGELPAWFNYSSKLSDSWDFEAQGAASGNVVYVSPIGFAKPGLTKVLALYSRASTAYDTAISKILDVVEDKQLRIGFTIVNYGGDLDLLENALRTAEAEGVKVIIAMGSDPVADLWTHYRNGKIPVVTVCAKDPVILGQAASYERGSGTNFAFTSLNMPVEAQMGYLLRLRPRLKNLGILVDAANVSAVETQAKPIVEYLNKMNIRAFQIAVKDGQDAKAELPGLLTHAVSVMQRTDPTFEDSAFWITGSTSIFQQIALINKYADKIPVISGVPEVVRAGDDSAVLSIGVSFESNAYLAAVYLTDLLTGKSRPETMKVGIVTPPDIAINFRRVKAINLRIPFSIFDESTTIYDYDGRVVRSNGVMISKK